MNGFTDRDGALDVPAYQRTRDQKDLKEAAQALQRYVVSAYGRVDNERMVDELARRGWPRDIVVKYISHYGKQREKREQRMRSLVVFGLLFAIVGAFFLLREPTITGFAVLDNQMIFAENATLDLGMNVTSLRISGAVQGMGSARVYLGAALVAEFVLEGNDTLPIPELPNATIPDGTLNLTNESIANDSVVTILELVETNATNTSETVTANVSIPANETLVDILPIEVIIEFSELCVETCGNISASALRIEIDGTVLTIARFNYTVETAALPELNVTLNVTNHSVLPTVALKNRRNIDTGQAVVRNNSDGTFEIELRTRPVGGVGLALVESEVVLRGVRDTVNITAKIDDYIGEEPRSGEITTDVVAVSNVTLDNATVRLVKNGDVNAIVKCADFDIEAFSCGVWEKTEIPFVDLGDVIEFTVTGFSGYGGAQLSVINVKSFPRLGGNWTVFFNTTGAANLTIAAVNGTTWSNNEDVGDLRFIEVRCGDVVQSYQWINDSVFIANYSCAVNSSEVSKTLTEGGHNLMFTFGGDVAFAFNDVNTKATVQNVTLNTTNIGTNDSDTNLTLYYNVTDAEGNRLKNITVWYVNLTSFAAFFMPFENGSSNASNSSFARDYSFFGNNGTVSGGATIQPLGGFDGYGAYSFDGRNDVITANMPDIGQSGFTIELRMLPRANLSRANYSGNMCILDTGVVDVCIAQDDFLQVSVPDTSSTVGWNYTKVSNSSGTTIYAMIAWNNTLYVGMGGTNQSNVSRYDGLHTWTNIGNVTPVNSNIYPNALAAWNGTLYAGEFSTTGSPTGGVYRYEGGTTWVRSGRVMDSCTNAVIEALTVWNGSLYAAASGISACTNGSIYRYDGGTAWTYIGLGAGVSQGSIYGLIAWNNTLYTMAQDGHVYRYESNNDWTDLGKVNNTAGFGETLGIWNGSLYVGVTATAPTNASIFRYNNSENAAWGNWSWIGQLTGGAENAVKGMIVFNGTLYATGGSSSTVVYKWNGSEFNYTNISSGTPQMMAVWNGSLWVGSTITDDSNQNAIVSRYGNGTTLRSTKPLWDGGWQHVVVTRNATEMNLYINGVRNATALIYGQPSPTLKTQYGGIRIGSGWGSTTGQWVSGNDFNGSIDDVRIYNRSLGSRQVWALYTNQTNVIDANETTTSEVWQACVTVNDGTDDGPTACSNNLTVLQPSGVGGDTIAPNVTLLVPGPSPIVNSSFLRNTDMDIGATVLDGTFVSNVSINLTYPNGSIQMFFLANATAYPTKYNMSFRTPRVKGLFTVQFYANDSAKNLNATEDTNFTINNTKPTVTSSILNTTNLILNSTDDNLTLYVSTTDTDGDPTKNITDWRVNLTSFAIFNMPFESGDNASNSTFTRDYSSYGNNGTVTGPIHRALRGFDAWGAYVFEGDTDYITAPLPSIGQEGFTLELRIHPRPNITLLNLSGDMCPIDTGGARICLTRDGRVEASYSGNDTESRWNLTLSEPIQTTGTVGLEEFAVWNNSLYILSGNNGSLYRYNANNGTHLTWIGEPGGNNSVDALSIVVWNDTMYVGTTAPVGGSRGGPVYRYDSTVTNWTSVGYLAEGVSSINVNVLTVWNGTMYGGIGNINSSVFRYDGGTTWTWIGQVPGNNIQVRTMIVWNGSLYAGLGTTNATIYRYDGGTSWTLAGELTNITNVDSFVIYNGSLFAGGGKTSPTNASVFRYDGGTTWTYHGQVGPGGTEVNSMAVWNGTLFSTGTGKIVHWWNGTDWNNETPEVTGSATTLEGLFAYNGSLYAAGTADLFRYGDGTSVLSTGDLWENVYHHIIVTKNTSNLNLYIDGVLNVSQVLNSSQLGATMKSPVQIGRAWGGSGESVGTHDFNGTIDEIRIYNRSLSPRQIWALWNNRTDIIDSNETRVNEFWQACVTANDGSDDSPTVCANVTVTAGDSVPPAVTSVLPALNSQFNASQSFEIAATVTDVLSIVSRVIANITLPNSSTQLVTLSNASTHPTKYNVSYTLPKLRGLYNITIRANDTAFNVNETERTNFTVGHQKPVIQNLTLNTTNIASNGTDVNLTLYFNTSDPDDPGPNATPMKNITDWRIGGTSYAVLNMYFESGDNASNVTFTRDYSSYGNNGTVDGAQQRATSGYDGYGAYLFDGLNDSITAALPSVGSSGFSIELFLQPKANFSMANLSGDLCAIDAGSVRVCFTRDGALEASIHTKNGGDRWSNGTTVQGTTTSRGDELIVFNGTLYAIGGGGNSTTTNTSIFRYNGTNFTWVGSPPGGDTGDIYSFGVWNGSLYVGTGHTTSSNGSVWRYDGGTDWTWVGQLIDGGASNYKIQTLITWNGSLYAGKGTSNNSVWRYNGGINWSWTGNVGPYTNGTNTNGNVLSLVVWNGSMYAGVGDSNGSVYRYNGDNTWIWVGEPITRSKSIESFVVWNGSLYAGAVQGIGSPSNASISRYDGGTSWTWAGDVPGRSRMYALTVWNGTLFASSNDGEVYFYNGSTELSNTSVISGSAFDPVALSVWNGSLYALTAANQLHQWGNGASLVSTGDIIDNNYHHVIVTKDSSSFNLYIDGVLNSSLAHSLMATLKSPVQIGRAWGGSKGVNGLEYDGIIDDVRIYNRGLSAAQVGLLSRNRTDVISSDETLATEVWQACVTPNDGIDNGPTNCSNSITIRGEAESGSGATTTSATAASSEAAASIAPAAAEGAYVGAAPAATTTIGYSSAELSAIQTNMYIAPVYTPPPAYYASTAPQEAYQSVVVRDLGYSMTNEWSRPVSNIEISATSAPPPSLSMYTSKVVTTGLSSFGASTAAVDTRAITASVTEAVRINQLNPGETFSGTIQVNVPLATTTSVPVQLVYTTFGQEIATREVTVSVAPKVFASAIDLKTDQSAFNMYTVVSNPTSGDTTQQRAVQAVTLSAAEQSIRSVTSSQDITHAVQGVYQIVTTERATPTTLAQVDAALRPAVHDIMLAALSEQSVAEQIQDIQLDTVVAQLVDTVSNNVVAEHAGTLSQEKSDQSLNQMKGIVSEIVENAATDIVAQTVQPYVDAEVPHADVEQIISDITREKAIAIFESLSPEEGIEQVAREAANDIEIKIAVKDAAKKAVREAAQRADDFSVSDRVAERAVREASEQAIRESIEAIFEDVMAEVGEDVPAFIVDKAVDLAVEEAIKGITSESFIKQAIQDAPKEEIKDAVKAPIQDKFKDMFKGLPVRRGDDTDFKDAVEQAVQEVSEEMIQEAAETAIDEGVPESATKDIIQDAARQGVADALDDAVEESITEALDTIVPSEEIEEAVSASDVLVERLVDTAFDTAGEREIIKGLPIRRRAGDTAEITEELTEIAKDTLPTDEIEEAVKDIVEDAFSDEVVEESAAETVGEAIKDAVETGIDPEAIKDALDELVDIITDEDLNEVVEAVVDAALAEGLSEEDAKDVAEEAVTDAVVEVIKESVDEEIKQLSEDDVQNIVNEALSEGEIKDDVKEAVNEIVSSDAIEDAVSEAVKEETKEMVKDELEDAVADIVKDAVKDVLVDAVSEEAVKEAVKDAAREGIIKVVEDVVEEIGAKALAADSEKEIQAAVQEAIEEAVQDMIKEISTEDAVKESINAVVEEIAQRVVADALSNASIDEEVKIYLDRTGIAEAATLAVGNLSDAGADAVANDLIAKMVSESISIKSSQALAQRVLTEDVLRNAAQAALDHAIQNSVPEALIQDSVREALQGAGEELIREVIDEVTGKVVKDTIRGVTGSAIIPSSIAARVDRSVKEKMAKEQVLDSIEENVKTAIAKLDVTPLLESVSGGEAIPTDETRQQIKSAVNATFPREAIRETAKSIVKNELGIALQKVLKNAAKKAIPKDIVLFAAKNALQNSLKRLRNPVMLDAPEIVSEPISFGGALTGAAIATEMMELSTPERTIKEAIRRVLDEGIPQESIVFTLQAAARETVSSRAMESALENVMKQHFAAFQDEAVIIDAISDAAEETVKEVVVEVVAEEVWSNVQFVISTAVPEEIIRSATEEVIQEAIIQALPDRELKQLIDKTLDPLRPEDLTLEMTVKKAAARDYSPSLGMGGFFESVLNGPSSVSSELLGPYPIKPDERFLLGQQFQYPPHLVGEYDVELTYRKGTAVIGKQSHKINLKKDCTQDTDCPSGYLCAEKLCVENGQMNVAQLVGRGLALATVLSVLMLCGYSALTYKRRRKNAALLQLQKTYDTVVAEFVRTEFGKMPEAAVVAPIRIMRQAPKDYSRFFKNVLVKIGTYGARKNIENVEKNIKDYGQTLLELIKAGHQRTVVTAIEKGSEESVQQFIKQTEHSAQEYGHALVGFVHQCMRKNWQKSRIVEALMKKGWSKKVAEAAVDKITMAAQRHADVRNQLKTYNSIICTFVGKGLDRGFTQEQIKGALVAKGLNGKIAQLYIDYVVKGRKK